MPVRPETADQLVPFQCRVPCDPLPMPPTAKQFVDDAHEMSLNPAVDPLSAGTADHADPSQTCDSGVYW
jgi:hypothetical protein